ncbi:MAG: response regulator [Sandaracinaceae bacterium]|nr:response regulator [Sandaracinaceae bacterium]
MAFELAPSLLLSSSSPQMTTLLLIEDEELLRKSLIQALGKIPGIEILAVGSLREAQELIDKILPDIVISDLRLPDGWGGEIVDELKRRGVKVPMVFISAFLQLDQAKLPEEPDIVLLEKPVLLAELRKIVRNLVEIVSGEALNSTEAPFSAAEYVQMAALGRHSVRIHCECDEEGQNTGDIDIWQGELWHARDGEGKGEAAFRRIVTRAKRCTCKRLDSPPKERTILTGWEHLLLDAFREHDESKSQDLEADFAFLPELSPGDLHAKPQPKVDGLLSSSEHSPENGHVLEPSHTEQRLQIYAQAMEEGIAALLARDFERAKRAFERAIEARPNDPVAHANLARLELLQRPT